MRQYAAPGAVRSAGEAVNDLIFGSRPATAGEMRVSNFLLWQISYAELHVTSVYWPEFGRAELCAAIRDYAGRRRRFGGLDHAEPRPAGG